MEIHQVGRERRSLQGKLKRVPEASYVITEPRSVHEVLECAGALQEYCPTYNPQSESKSRDETVVPNIFSRLNDS